MRVLVIGSGGREHALCWAIAASPLLEKLWCAPGNPGIAKVAECVPIGVMDFPELVEFAKANRVDLVIPGPEAPLVAGIGDAMAAAGITCCGPDMAAARLEGSKTFANEICDAAGIPTAKWERFEDIEACGAEPWLGELRQLLEPGVSSRGQQAEQFAWLRVQPANRGII